MSTIPSLAPKSSPLTLEESHGLEQLETVIERGFASFIEVGEALAAIRNQRLYRQTHKRFDDYCRERWAMDRSRAYQLINASEILEDVDNCRQKPATESQARPLSQVPRERRASVWQEAVNSSPRGKVTAKYVEKVVRGTGAKLESEFDLTVAQNRVERFLRKVISTWPKEYHLDLALLLRQYSEQIDPEGELDRDD